MELEEFLEKFLPDYKARLNKFRIEEGYAPIAFEVNGVKEFCVQNFPEALQNFSDRICEKQRENCDCQNKQNSIDWAFAKKILNAEPPKINEL